MRTSIRLSLQKRIRELEETLMEERRARESAELRCERLEKPGAGGERGEELLELLRSRRQRRTYVGCAHRFCA